MEEVMEAIGAVGKDGVMLSTETMRVVNFKATCSSGIMILEINTQNETKKYLNNDKDISNKD